MVPVKYRIPVLQTGDLVVLTEVLLRYVCSEKTYERVSKAVGFLGELLGDSDRKSVHSHVLIRECLYAGNFNETGVERSPMLKQ